MFAGLFFGRFIACDVTNGDLLVGVIFDEDVQLVKQLWEPCPKAVISAKIDFSILLLPHFNVSFDLKDFLQTGPLVSVHSIMFAKRSQESSLFSMHTVGIILPRLIRDIFKNQ